jgi:hypothetical protein
LRDAGFLLFLAMHAASTPLTCKVELSACWNHSAIWVLYCCDAFLMVVSRIRKRVFRRCADGLEFVE